MSHESMPTKIALPGLHLFLARNLLVDFPDGSVLPATITDIDYLPLSDISPASLISAGYQSLRGAAEVMGLSPPYDSILTALMTVVSLQHDAGAPDP